MEQPNLTHQLNCALLIGQGQPCSCGVLEPRPKSLDDATGEEWNAASRDYRSKIASVRFPRPEAPEPPLGPPEDSEKSDGSPGEVRTTSSTGGQKGVKLAQFGLLPPEALLLVAEHYGKGAEKYEVHNWRKGFEWSKSYDAMQRHLQAFWSGQDLDPETNSPHLAAVVFHALTLLTFATEHPEFDDRYKTNTNKESK